MTSQSLHICIYTCICIYIHACMYIYLYIYSKFIKIHLSVHIVLSISLSHAYYFLLWYAYEKVLRANIRQSPEFKTRYQVVIKPFRHSYKSTYFLEETRKWNLMLPFWSIWWFLNTLPFPVVLVFFDLHNEASHMGVMLSKMTLFCFLVCIEFHSVCLPKKAMPFAIFTPWQFYLNATLPKKLPFLSYRSS